MLPGRVEFCAPMLTAGARGPAPINQDGVEDDDSTGERLEARSDAGAGGLPTQPSRHER